MKVGLRCEYMMQYINDFIKKLESFFSNQYLDFGILYHYSVFAGDKSSIIDVI